MPGTSSTAEHDTVDGIKCHVKQQSQADDACFREDAQEHVDADWNGPVQRVKADAAACGIVYGARPKMVDIYRQSCQQ